MRTIDLRAHCRREEGDRPGGRLLIAVVLTVALALSAGCASGGAFRPPSRTGATQTLRAGLRAGSLFTGGRLRTWTLYVPPGLDRTRHTPLVVVLHGSGSSGARCLVDNGWMQEADRRGFIVAAPDGLPVLPDAPADAVANPTLWNEGRLRNAGPRTAIDDVAFIEAMLDRLGADLPIDRQRTYVAGVSNGGSMAFRLAAEASDRFAALVVAASVPWTAERPERPMPTLVIVGTEDRLVPLRGGIVRSQWFKEVRPPLRPMLYRWARALGMRTPVITTVIDDENVLIEDWAANPADSSPGTSAPTPMTVVYVKGYGHGWPGGVGAGLPRNAAGPTAQAVDATRLAWEFFARSPAR